MDPEKQPEKQNEGEYPYWNRVYLTAVIYTILLIAGLWAFSRIFR